MRGHTSFWGLCIDFENNQRPRFKNGDNTYAEWNEDK
jgi:hypothetical protein